MEYKLEHMGTQQGTGWFSPMPVEGVEFEEGLEYIKNHPNDEFMHNYLLNLGTTFGPNLVRHLIKAAPDEGPHLLALMYELCILNERPADLSKDFGDTDIGKLAERSPLIYIRWSLKQRGAGHTYWLKVFTENILQHKKAIPVQDPQYSIPFDQDRIDAWKNRTTHINKIIERCNSHEPASTTTRKLPPAETSQRAAHALETIGLKTDHETINQASLIPFALQMNWQMEICVSTGKDDWHLTGLQTSYGKGLNVEEAEASCLMEVVERVSAFAGFDSGGAVNYKKDHMILKGCLEDLRSSYDLMDPNEILLEVPYENQSLYWVRAERVDKEGHHSIYVPAQLVFLFCNLDEVSLTNGLPSTGLASGNTLEEARLSGLLEVIERDAEKVVPYSRGRCFRLKPDMPAAKEILENAADRGLDIQFLDITAELGIPCYKAFIVGPEGQILKGSAAHLDGKRALVSALTELPYHHSWFQPVPALNNPATVKEENIPNYSSGDSKKDLRLLERLLLKNDYRPIYVDLTRKDLDIPVAKVLVPGLELFSDFDRFSPLSFRQYAHYLNTKGLKASMC